MGAFALASASALKRSTASRASRSRLASAPGTAKNQLVWSPAHPVIRYEEYTDGFERIGAALEGCESTLRFSALQRGKAELHEQVVSANRPTVSEAVSAHRAAYDAFQVAPDENVNLNAVLDAQSAMQTALIEMLTTPCVSRLDALALRSHLQWWLADEAEFEADYQPAYAIAQARATELTMLLNGGVP